MSGNGSTFSDFKSDSVLPTEIPTATSSGEVLNGMKSAEMPPVQANPVQPTETADESMTGGRRHKSSKKSRRAKHRKSASKKNRSKKHGGKKHRSKKHRSKK